MSRDQTRIQDSTTPMTRTHFNAEGEVSFKAILFVPNAAERDMFNDYGQKKTDHIKVKYSSF